MPQSSNIAVCATTKQPIDKANHHTETMFGTFHALSICSRHATPCVVIAEISTTTINNHDAYKPQLNVISALCCSRDDVVMSIPHNAAYGYKEIVLDSQNKHSRSKRLENSIYSLILCHVIPRVIWTPRITVCLPSSNFAISYDL